jgi:hypothetical protein
MDREELDSEELDSEELARKELTERVSDFYDGCYLLERVAAWAYVMANHQMILEKLTSFEKAYGQLIELVASGKAGAGAADMSAENLERVKRIIHLMQPGLDSSEARQAAQEIHTLAERCMQGLTRTEASPVGREAP